MHSALIAVNNFFFVSQLRSEFAKHTTLTNESHPQTLEMMTSSKATLPFTVVSANEPTTDFLSDDSINFLSRYQVVLPPAIADLTSTVTTTELSGTYEPSEYDVVCGRGKGSYNRPGNKRFRAIVHEHIPNYLATKTKLDKSLVLSKIIDCVRQQNNGTTRFVKHDKKNNRWVEISDDLAREKVGHAVREAIAASQQSNTATGNTKVHKERQAIQVLQFSMMATPQQDLLSCLMEDSTASVVSI